MNTRVHNKFILSIKYVAFSYDDGEYEIIFNITDLNFVCETITVAITRAGTITQDTFPLLRDKDGKLYFEFDLFYENKIHIDDFDEVD